MGTSKDWREEKINQGLCPKCGKNEIEEGYSNCSGCRQKNKEDLARRRRGELNPEWPAKRKFKVFRKAKRMSQQDLSLALGITRRTVINIESGSGISYKVEAQFNALVERHLQASKIGRTRWNLKNQSR